MGSISRAAAAISTRSRSTAASSEPCCDHAASSTIGSTASSAGEAGAALVELGQALLYLYPGGLAGSPPAAIGATASIAAAAVAEHVASAVRCRGV